MHLIEEIFGNAPGAFGHLCVWLVKNFEIFYAEQNFSNFEGAFGHLHRFLGSVKNAPGAFGHLCV